MTPRIPPPLVAAVAALLIWLLARYSALVPMPIPFKDQLAVLLALAGLSIIVLGVASFHRASTTINPLRPEDATTLVISGIYRCSRNPMYLGIAIILLGWVVYLAEWSALLVLAGFIAYMNRFQIKPEEAALESQFGPAFIQYKRTVRRWL